jgi:hypothetical protein
MNKTKFVVSIAVLFLLTTFLFMNALGYAISQKYEVDQAYWQAKTPRAIEKLDKKGSELEIKSMASVIGGLLAFATGVVLIVKKVKS